MGLSGWLGRRFGQGAVARVRNTMGLGGFGPVGAVLRCAAVGCGGDKDEAGGRAEEWEKGKTAKQDAGASSRLAGEREGERERD